MSKMPKIIAVAAAPVMALSLTAAPASAQSYRDRDRDDDSAKNALIGAAVGGLAGALYGNGDGRYIAGAALAGAALGAVATNRGSGCEYYRGGRCYRNQGHWEREHGINSRDPRWEQRRDYRDWRREQRYDRRDDRRDYRYDRRW
jgi:hypothetical protein